MIHELKTWPQYYDVIISGHKTFEVRKNDRHFEVGDLLILKEYHPITGYTGKQITKEITYILPGGSQFGIHMDHVVIGFNQSEAEALKETVGLLKDAVEAWEERDMGNWWDHNYKHVCEITGHQIRNSAQD
jgi:hypothetical protein